MKNDGGPAFPGQECLGYEEGERLIGFYSGMSLRDWFAGQALKGIIIHAKNDSTASMSNSSNGDLIDRGRYAMTAYAYADAMIKEREK